MTTTPPTTGQAGSSPNKNGANDADTSAKAKAKLEANKEKKKRRKQKEKERKKDNNNNNNYVRFDGLITEGIMKGVTVSPGSSASMTTDFRNFKKSAAAYVAAKGYEHWPGVIETMEPVDEKEWKTKHPDKSMYAVKRTTKLKTDGAADIMKQEWIVIDCEKQEEAKDNYSNMQRQKLTEHALYRKNGAAMYTTVL